METLNPKVAPRPLSAAASTARTRRCSPMALPWLTILLGSLTPWLPIIAPAPVLPPFGFLLMLAWRLLRPGLLPLWAGLPLGLFDDLYSAASRSAAACCCSRSTLIAVELIEIRFPWRNFWLDWLTASAILIAYLVVAALLSGAELDARAAAGHRAAAIALDRAVPHRRPPGRPCSTALRLMRVQAHETERRDAASSPPARSRRASTGAASWSARSRAGSACCSRRGWATSPSPRTRSTRWRRRATG